MQAWNPGRALSGTSLHHSEQPEEGGSLRWLLHRRQPVHAASLRHHNGEGGRGGSVKPHKGWQHKTTKTTGHGPRATLKKTPAGTRPSFLAQRGPRTPSPHPHLVHIHEVQQLSQQ